MYSYLGRYDDYKNEKLKKEKKNLKCEFAVANISFIKI